MAWASVDLPAPFGPIIAWNSPGFISKFTPLIFLSLQLTHEDLLLLM